MFHADNPPYLSGDGKGDEKGAALGGHFLSRNGWRLVKSPSNTAAVASATLRCMSASCCMSERRVLPLVVVASILREVQSLYSRHWGEEGAVVVGNLFVCRSHPAKVARTDENRVDHVREQVDEPQLLCFHHHRRKNLCQSPCLCLGALEEPDRALTRYTASLQNRIERQSSE